LSVARLVGVLVEKIPDLGSGKTHADRTATMPNKALIYTTPVVEAGNGSYVAPMP
jgi:hypothetical protein